MNFLSSNKFSACILYYSILHICHYTRMNILCVQSYIVYLGGHDELNAPEIYLAEAELHRRRAHSHRQFLSSFLGGRSVCDFYIDSKWLK